MKLFPGHEEEYQRRHAAIWPELQLLLRQSGIRSYSIFHDAETDLLLAVMEVEDPAGLASLPGHPVMKRWWEHMKDIMDTNADHSPVSIPMKEVFRLDPNRKL